MDVDLDVPGTTRIIDETGEVVASNNFTLVPPPSADPNDPLNWSQPRKYLHLACLILYTMGICFCAGSLAAIYAPVSEATGLSLDDLNSGVGYLYLGMGLFQILTQSLALAIGKRPVYVVSILLAGAYPFWITKVRSSVSWVLEYRLTAGRMVRHEHLHGRDGLPPVHSPRPECHGRVLLP